MIIKDFKYIPKLDTIRFFAALSVIVHHLENGKNISGLSNIFGFNTIRNLGGHAVTIFFMLSGFLITLLLLKEYQKTGKIEMKKFFLRRIFRIWPLYYFLVVLSFFVLPYFFSDQSLFGNKEDWAMTLILYICFLPVIANKIFLGNRFSTQLWSISIEEQFYLIWPLIVKKWIGNLGKAIIWFVAIKIAFQLLVYAICFLMLKYVPNHPWIEGLLVFKVFIKVLYVETMAIGAYGAYLIFNKKENVLKWIFNPAVEIATLIFFVALFFVNAMWPFVHPLVGMSGMILILNIVYNEKSILSFNTKLTDKLGKYSYGMYMYHNIIIFLCINNIIKLDLDNSILFNVLLYVTVIVITILISMLSYKILETPFLKLKDKFANV
ncbi:acyltransferase [uncultured Cytophaga sp.]|uniref:acyltransferase family protein n=1 Tax=uncultured Cytophaga sp. TaxID=160238 RepID=UPI002606CF7B|nr:acyltransferase [uncultured Cytophaga sp.]